MPDFSKPQWALRFHAPFSFANSVSAEFTENGVCCKVITDQAAFTLEAPKGHAEYTLIWLTYAVRLYADGSLMDEDWPLGSVQDAAGEADFTDAPEIPPEKEVTFTAPMQYFTPLGHNTSVGDCMPFARDNRYCLYYLLDRRGHRSKCGLGAHQWAQISSADLKTWTIHPMAVPITAQWEGSICTGSLIQKGGITYAFYAVRMSDRTPAKLTYATSEDGVHFVKSGNTFSLTDPYEPVIARDPMVFADEDGLYHMLVSTNLVGSDAPEYPGCLAHLTSADLQQWTQLSPFYVPGYSDTPECSDYFKWGNWYYLVFSNYGTARYRMSEDPFGPWSKPKNDILDTTLGRVAKTAAYKKRRLVSSFLTPYPETYAGYAITHELFQKADGTLGSKFCKELQPQETAVLYSNPTLPILALEGRSFVHLATAKNFRLQVKMITFSNAMRFGIILTDENGDKYHIDMNTAEKRISIVRPGQEASLGESRAQLLGVTNFNIDLYLYKEALDMHVGSDRMLTYRVPHKGNLRVSLYAMDGFLAATNITLSALEEEHDF